MARKPSLGESTRASRAWSVNGASPVGAVLVFDRRRWVVINWDRRRRALTLVSQDATMSVNLLNPLCMQWEN